MDMPIYKKINYVFCIIQGFSWPLILSIGPLSFLWVLIWNDLENLGKRVDSAGNTPWADTARLGSIG